MKKKIGPKTRPDYGIFLRKDYRLEYYSDPHQANIVTKTSNGFQVTGLSINFDQKLDEAVLWRTELRGFSSKDKIYPQGKREALA